MDTPLSRTKEETQTGLAFSEASTHDSCRAGFAPAEEWHLVTAHGIMRVKGTGIGTGIRSPSHERRSGRESDPWRRSTGRRGGGCRTVDRRAAPRRAAARSLVVTARGEVVDLQRLRRPGCLRSGRQRRAVRVSSVRRQDAARRRRAALCRPNIGRRQRDGSGMKNSPPPPGISPGSFVLPQEFWP